MRAIGVSKADANEIRDAIVLQHLSLVRAIAVRVHESLPVHVDLDDLVHAWRADIARLRAFRAS